jgi:hypothetical protein
MGRWCTICCHPERRAIDAALIEHELPYRAIAHAYRVSNAGLYRHRVYHLRERLEEAKMLDAQALAARMAHLDGYVDRILESAGRDKRLALMAIAEGRRNVDTLARLLVLHAAQQRDEQCTVAAEGYPPPVWDNHPETIRKVLRMLIESGVAALPPADDEQPEQGEQEHQSQDDDDGIAPDVLPV